MARTAREEGFDGIADWFETLAKAEKSHAGRFQKALDTLDLSIAMGGSDGAGFCRTHWGPRAHEQYEIEW